MIGRTLLHYQVTSVIGAGGMGEVYRATDTKLGREVALKVLPPGMARDPERLARFQREARAVAALNHPNIVTMYSVEEEQDVHFLTMELVEGQSLDRRIPSGGLPVEQILEIAGALADALYAAHEKGIVHRDLKPANVMVTDDGRVKVLDFGLAKDIRARSSSDETLASAQTQMGMVLGTPAYMSPEQISARVVDHRTDIFSLGVLLHEMSTGRRPFEADSSAELASAILRDDPASVTELRPGLPADLARIIGRCLEKDPRLRMQTARDVKNELRDLERQLSLLPPVSPALPSGSVRSPSVATDSVTVRAGEGFWVAVLPFRFAGTSPEIKVLAEGLSEEIITGLSRFSYLRVIARGSTLRYGNQSGDLREVGKELGARYVMEGTLRVAGPKLRVAVQLVDTNSGAHLWADTFDRAFAPDEIFALQDELVPRIVCTVADRHGVLPHSMSEAVRSKDETQLTPHEAVLRAFGYFERITPDEHALVLRILERAVKEAPENSDCWAMLSMLYRGGHAQGYGTVQDAMSRALAAAHRAVDAAPSNHLAYFALASTLFFQNDKLGFRAATEQCLELNPMDGASMAFLGMLTSGMGLWEHGEALLESAMRLNPNHPGWYQFAIFYNAYHKREYQRALKAALRINLPGYFYTHAVQSAAYGQLGDRTAAQLPLQKLIAIRPHFASEARVEWGKWHEPDEVEHLLAGLRKAGLEISEQEAPELDASAPVATTDSGAAPTRNS